MGTKRAPAKSPAPTSAASPFLTATLLASAVALGIGTLVWRGKLTWPPTQLLASLFTVAGCLALVGPVVLAIRRDKTEGGVGELVWMTGGLIVWVFDLAAVVRGEWRVVAWPTPLGYQAMGLTVLAVLVAGWRWRSGTRDWSWTNVAGWVLGLFWVGMGLATMAPSGAVLASAR